MFFSVASDLQKRVPYREFLTDVLLSKSEIHFKSQRVFSPRLMFASAAQYRLMSLPELRQ
jgi:hypothetical protein